MAACCWSVLPVDGRLFLHCTAAYWLFELSIVLLLDVGP
jgi:hypothetical protein